MKEITIKILGLGIQNKCQALIKIWNQEKQLLYQDKTYNGQITIELKEKKPYLLEIYSCLGNKKIFFYVDKNETYYQFNIQKENIIKKVIFHLIDANYRSLPIEKGEIILWLK